MIANKLFFLKFYFIFSNMGQEKFLVLYDLSYVVPVKSTTKISQHFVAFSEYMNFISDYS